MYSSTSMLIKLRGTGRNYNWRFAALFGYYCHKERLIWVCVCCYVLFLNYGIYKLGPFVEVGEWGWENMAIYWTCLFQVTRVTYWSSIVHYQFCISYGTQMTVKPVGLLFKNWHHFYSTHYIHFNFEDISKKSKKK